MHDEMFEKVSTLVFLDLEATGLPSDVGKSNVHITEMSFVAVDRVEFESNQSLRVINKLSLCIQPRAPVSPAAMTITGLFNDSLENQKQFDDSIPKLIEYFFRRLQAPICILAHNGNKYDFPLLQAELRRVNYSLDCSIMCADTLEALKGISYKLNKSIQTPATKNEMKVKQKPRNIDILDELINDDEIDNLLSEDMDIFANIVEPIEYTSSRAMQSKTDVITPRASNSIKPHCQFIDERTPPKPDNVEDGDFVKRKKSKTEVEITPESHSTTSAHNAQPRAKRKLFEDNSFLQSHNFKSGRPKITSFSLEKLYFLFFGENPPTSHYAEADCIALSKVCQIVHKEFLPWIDEHNSSFSVIRPMW